MPAQDASLMANCFMPIRLAQQQEPVLAVARSAYLPSKTPLKGDAPRTPSVRQLHQRVVPVTGATLCADILNLFLQNANLYAIPVVDLARVPRALIERYSYIEYFSRPYAIELFGLTRFIAHIDVGGPSHKELMRTIELYGTNGILPLC